MKVIAVSGGVDSMTLSHLYRNKNVVLAFVNYNLREDSKKEQKIVENFAKKYNLKLEKLILHEHPENGNFQDWARKIRYDFFYKIYKKYNCNALLVAHHKDDFLETCIMQEMKNKNKLFYGIKQKTKINNMNVIRPLLFRFWKQEIYEFANKHQIPFNDDHTNFKNKYTRNKIRNNVLSKLNCQEKEKMLSVFLEKNSNNCQKLQEVQQEFKMWKKSKFDTKNFKIYHNQNELIIQFVNNSVQNINLNNKIIDNIKKFILKNENNKSFKLSDGYLIYKNANKLSIK